MNSSLKKLTRDLEMYIEEAQRECNDGHGELRQHLIRLFLLRWPSPIVCRDDIDEFSGGLFASGTLANMDSLKKGIKKLPTRGKRKVCYETIKAAQFIVDQLILD